MEPLQLLESAVEGDRRALARLLRIVEDRGPGSAEVLAEAWKKASTPHLVGITGAPGSGKSTLTNALITAWRAVDRRVAVVAVDPSSPFTGGALLGDRIRMQDHVADRDVFVRSMSSRGRLGGLAEATAGLVTLFEAARFDPVVVETVGVGQSEVDVVYHTDTVVVVVTPGWGDGIQADKAGILEVGDVFVINKADRAGVAESRRSLEAMLQMASPDGWTPPVIETVATAGTGIEELADALDRHRRHLVVGQRWRERRRLRSRAYIEWAVGAEIASRLDQPDLDGAVEAVTARRVDPWTAAAEFLDH
ncbi:MAG TPA: methylmalonyl Co-A mutase-associated GTPase MeaB [Acidimicrobiia bacterium]|nr:methylmalonyl Co-A mutase-associated GTPase MeaB [Acidimicrobiia bacterium]